MKYKAGFVEFKNSEVTIDPLILNIDIMNMSLLNVKNYMIENIGKNPDSLANFYLYEDFSDLHEPCIICGTETTYTFLNDEGYPLHRGDINETPIAYVCKNCYMNIYRQSMSLRENVQYIDYKAAYITYKGEVISPVIFQVENTCTDLVDVKDYLVDMLGKKERDVYDLYSYQQYDNFGGACVSCGNFTTRAFFDNDNCVYIRKSDMKALFFCEDCFKLTQNIPVELDMKSSRYTEHVLSTVNGDMKLPLTNEQAYALLVAVSFATHAGRIIEKVKKSIGQGENTLWDTNMTSYALFDPEIDMLLSYQNKVNLPIAEHLLEAAKNMTKEQLEKIVAGLGLVGEGTEYLEVTAQPILRPAIYKADHDKEVKELGDTGYYLHWAASTIMEKPETVFWRNRLKLWKRFMGKFSSKKSAERVDTIQ